jgi:transglutaminase-like putative cysteine protease
MQYAIRHTTRFTYSAPVRESVMEVRLQPRSEQSQRCERFELSTDPRASVSSYRDSLGNVVHHFDIPEAHRELLLMTESLVEIVGDCPALPSLGLEAWRAVDGAAASADAWEMTQESAFARRTPLLDAFAASIGAGRGVDPSSLVLKLARAVHGEFVYERRSTRVDSPIDEALAARRGVCQDFAHILIALVRGCGIPCRYVSGYLFPRREERSTEGAMHAWVEVWLPEGGWIGIDPTADELAGSNHVRVAVGRDYADIAPTRGVFKGEAVGELAVAVHMSRDRLPPVPASFSPVLVWTTPKPDRAVVHSAQQQ